MIYYILKSFSNDFFVNLKVTKKGARTFTLSSFHPVT